MKQFFQPQESSMAEIKEKSSKFLAFVYLVKSEEEVAYYVRTLRKEYPDAHHHCHAYLIGLESQTYKVSDDGEPSHSAGEPILGQIRSVGLTNTLVVVVRYFGGIKLGVGGLTSAYREAAKEALSKVKRVEIFELISVRLQFGYHQIAWIEHLLSTMYTEEVVRDFGEYCLVAFLIKKNNLAFLKQTLEGSTVKLFI